MSNVRGGVRCLPFACLYRHEITSPKISHGAFRLFAFLVFVARSDSGKSWYTNAALQHEMGASERTVRDWLRELEAEGFIKRHINCQSGQATVVEVLDPSKSAIEQDRKRRAKTQHTTPGDLFQGEGRNQDSPPPPPRQSTTGGTRSNFPRAEPEEGKPEEITTTGHGSFPQQDIAPDTTEIRSRGLRGSSEAINIPDDLKPLALYREDRRLCKAWPALIETWAGAYSSRGQAWVLSEVRKAHAWEVANPERRKKLRAAFLNNWLSRAQDKPQDKPTAGQHQQPRDWHRVAEGHAEAPTSPDAVPMTAEDLAKIREFVPGVAATWDAAGINRVNMDEHRESIEQERVRKADIARRLRMASKGPETAQGDTRAKESTNGTNTT